MEITVDEHIVRILVVAPQGRIDAFTAPDLRQRLTALGESGVNFVINLAAVPFIDSAGMAVLVSLLKHVRQSGGDVKLVWPEAEAARRIFTLTRFDRVFDIAEDVPAALKQFSG
jgi:anti-anti-sigma factor